MEDKIKIYRSNQDAEMTGKVKMWLQENNIAFNVEPKNLISFELTMSEIIDMLTATGGILQIN